MIYKMSAIEEKSGKVNTIKYCYYLFPVGYCKILFFTTAYVSAFTGNGTLSCHGYFRVSG